MKIYDFHEYWVPAAKNLELITIDYTGPIPSSVFKHIDSLLGSEEGYLYSTRPTTNDYPIKEPFKEALIKLAGPYGKTIAKVMKIQRGLHE